MNSEYNWTNSTPEEKGMNQETLRKMDREISAKYPNILSALIVKDGSIIYESYYRNTNPNQALPIMSVNKSILSGCIGIALEKGILTDLDQKVVGFFPELDLEAVDPQVHRLTLRHLLTMSSGFYYVRLAGDAQPIWQRTAKSRNWVQFSLSLPIRDAIGRHFNYKNTDAFLAAACLSRAAGKPVGELAEEWIFQPLNIRISPWRADDPQGLGIGSLSLTARDMAKFGQLYLQNGSWHGHQVIPEKWVKQSISCQVGNYGFLWWIHSDGCFSASGAGGVLIHVNPKMNIVSVFQSRHLKKFKDPRSILGQFVIPAISKQ
jgi:CubicO group peptidase (beta-lactamase class C family)